MSKFLEELKEMTPRLRKSIERQYSDNVEKGLDYDPRRVNNIIEYIKKKLEYPTILQLSETFYLRRVCVFEAVLTSLVEVGIMPIKHCRGIVEKCYLIERHIETMKQTGNTKHADFMYNVLTTSMKVTLIVSLLNVIKDGNPRLFPTFARAFKATYTMQNCNIDLKEINDSQTINGFYRQLIIVTCAGMRKPNKVNHHKMSPILTYNDIITYRTTESIVEPKAMLFDYVLKWGHRIITEYAIEFIPYVTLIWKSVTTYKANSKTD